MNLMNWFLSDKSKSAAEQKFAEPVSEIKVPVTEGEIFFAPASFVEVNQ